MMNSKIRCYISTVVLVFVAMLIIKSGDIYAGQPQQINKEVVPSKAKYKSKKLKPGQKATYLENYRYRVTVPSDGYLTIIFDKGNTGDLIVYRKLESEKVTEGWLYQHGYERKLIIPVSKGNYYFDGGFQLGDDILWHGGYKYKFTKVRDPENYCMTKAIYAKRNKEMKIFDTPDNRYKRWFKIKLTKKQKIAVSGGFHGAIFGGTADCDLYNSDLEYLENVGWHPTEKAYEPGIYYLVVSVYQDISTLEMPDPCFIKFSWIGHTFVK